MSYKKILLVEDHFTELFREMVDLMTGKNFEVVVAINGESAVRRAFVARPDIILIDLNLPRMGGIEAVRRIREFAPDLPIIAITAFVDEFTENEALDAGVTRYRTKPFDLVVILADIEELTEDAR